MSLADFLEEVWILIPVVFLFATGFGITLRSGTEGRVRIADALGNFTKAVVLLGICAVLMLAAQSFAGYKMGISW